MKRGIFLLVFLFSSQLLLAQNEIGPEGHKLMWVIIIGVAILVTLVIAAQPFKNTTKKQKKALFTRDKLKIELEKDALYYPDNLKLQVKNNGTTDVDVDKPLLVFDNFWLKRKFKIKGMGNHTFYPLYLEKNKSHNLEIDLTRFYSHDKSLKKFPKATVYLFDVKGKKLGRKSVFLRKTLFKF